MARYTTKLTALALLASVGIAHAGGFGRGSADTDLLFEEGNFNLRTGVTFVNPTREYTAQGNPALVGTNYADSYALFSGAVKLNITDDLRCTATMAEVYGGDATFASPTFPSGKLKETFDITEYGVTCGYKFDLSKGRAWILGGIFQEDFDYYRFNFRTPGTRVNLNLQGEDTGFRVGAAYEIPEIALRAQVMYRAATSYGADGRLDVVTVGGTPIVGAPAFGTGELPQSLEFKLQSGIAPGWLAFGSVKWTDWSVTEQLIVEAPLLGISGPTAQVNDYFWRDGWTITGGVGHAFNEQLSGAVSLTWDRGVGTGYDLSSDTWTLGVGGSFKDSFGGEIRLGVGLTYLASASTDPALTGDPIEAVGSDWAYAISGSYKAKW